MHQSVAFEKAFVVLVVLEILLEVTFVIVQLQSLADVLAIIVEGNSAFLSLLGLGSAVSCFQVVLVQIFLHILAFLEGSQIFLTK